VDVVGALTLRLPQADRGVSLLSRCLPCPPTPTSPADWTYQLAKPFASVHELPHILTRLSTLIQGLRIGPNMTVLDFGAGAGWASHYLAQLGCRVIAVDVSPTALRMVDERFRRQPPFGNRPMPRFLVFDGRRIDLPDASVDRIFRHDAFHHVGNPATVLQE